MINKFSINELEVFHLKRWSSLYTKLLVCEFRIKNTANEFVQNSYREVNKSINQIINDEKKMFYEKRKI